MSDERCPGRASGEHDFEMLRGTCSICGALDPLADQYRQVAAAAWREGWDARGEYASVGEGYRDKKNPYRSEVTA